MDKSDKNFKLIFKEIIDHIKIAVKNRNHPYHTPSFSNSTKGSFADSRIIVLRKFDVENLTLSFHTDLRSPKVEDLKKNDNSFFLFYDTNLRMQLRIRTKSKINYQNEITRNAWAKTSLSSRKCYLTLLPPSSTTLNSTDGIPNHLKGIDPGQIESEIGYNNFVVIQNKIKNIDWLHLSHKGHKRLNINLDGKNPKFNWLIP